MAVFGSNHLDGSGALHRLVAPSSLISGSATASADRLAGHLLNEGFACYAEWLWSQESGSLSCQLQAERHWELLADLPQDLVLTDPGAEEMFDDRVYKRGALTLQAVRTTIGDEAFFTVLQRWASDHRHGTATTAEFRQLAEQVHGASLARLFDAWLLQPQLPRLPRTR